MSTRTYSLWELVSDIRVLTVEPLYSWGAPLGLGTAEI